VVSCLKVGINAWFVLNCCQYVSVKLSADMKAGSFRKDIKVGCDLCFILCDLCSVLIVTLYTRVDQ